MASQFALHIPASIWGDSCVATHHCHIKLFFFIAFRYAYAPYQFLKRYGIKGPPPTPFLGHYKDRIKRLPKKLQTSK